MKKRIVIYLALVAVIVVGVVLKVGSIKEKRSAPTISVLKEWQAKGKPVEVTAAEKGEIVILERTTAQIESASLARAEVSRILQPKFKSGDQVFMSLGDEILAGRVTSVSRAPSSYSGLYDVRIKPDRNFDTKKIGQSVVVDVAVNRISNVVKVPQRAVSPEREGQRKIWKVDGQKVTQVSIKTGRSSKDYIEVLSGLKAGDEVVVRGGSLLEEGETVRVVSADLNRGKE